MSEIADRDDEVEDADHAEFRQLMEEMGESSVQALRRFSRRETFRSRSRLIAHPRQVRNSAYPRHDEDRRLSWQHVPVVLDSGSRRPWPPVDRRDPAHVSPTEVIMDYRLDDEHETLRKTVEEFAHDVVAPQAANDSTRRRSSRTTSCARWATWGCSGCRSPRSTAAWAATTSPSASPWRSSRASTPPWRSPRGRGVARCDADLPVRHRGAEAEVAARAAGRPRPRRVRADRAGRRYRRRRDADDRAGSSTASG